MADTTLAVLTKMWRNIGVLNFIEWLRQYNSTLPENARKVGFYGLDLSLDRTELWDVGEAPETFPSAL